VAVTFATGLVAGIVAAAFVGFLVFKARVIEGTANTRLPDLRMVIAVAALVVAIVALVRSGHTDPGATSTAPSSTSSPTSTSPEPSTSSVSSSSTTTSSVFSTVIVPNLVGLSQSAAVAELQNAGLKSKIESLPLSNVPAGFVVTQTPGALSTTTTGAVVMLGVSGAP
jgi:eukaryotic-like serine/threonine-protein kinase